jgi:hypothetical protein
LKGILDLNETPSKEFDWNQNFAHDTHVLNNQNLSSGDELMVGEEDALMEDAYEEEKKPGDDYELVKKLSAQSSTSSNLQQKMSANNGYQFQHKGNQ